MSKNISVKEGGVSRYFTAQKIRTNLQGGSTCDWVPIDEVDNYVELEELNVTENGIYYPAEKVGISKVSVDVPQQGSSVVPSGVSVRATAAENLTAGDCVYIISGGSGGVAGQAPCVINGQNISQIATDGNYVYYAPNNSTINRVPITNLTATPETYKSGITVNVMTRNIIECTENSVRVMRNLKTGVSLNGAYMNYKFQISQNYIGLRGPTQGFYGINDLSLALAYGIYTNAAYMITPNEYVLIGSNFYEHHVNGTSTRVNMSTEISSATDGRNNVINKKIIGVTLNKNSNDKYELIYYDLNEDNGTPHYLKDKNGNKIETDTNRIEVKFNDAGNIMLVMAGSGTGLVMVYEDLSTAIYSNIAGVSINSEMFKNYFYDAEIKQTYFVPQDSVMGKTNAKSHDGSLGFVGADVAAGTVGTATEMFR